MSGILRGLQQEITDILNADPFFANVPIFTEKLGDIQSLIQRGLGPLNQQGAVGLVGIVLTPSANTDWPNVGGPFLNDVRIVVSFWENVVINHATGGTQIYCADAAEQATGDLHQSFLSSANGPLVSISPTIRLVPIPLERHVRYDLAFRTMGGIRPSQPQVATPTFSGIGGAITLSCATPGAAIFYTLDGSNAIPRGTTATLYTGPFTPARGLLLKVRAWLAGYNASETAVTST